MIGALRESATPARRLGMVRSWRMPLVTLDKVTMAYGHLPLLHEASLAIRVRFANDRQREAGPMEGDSRAAARRKAEQLQQHDRGGGEKRRAHSESDARDNNRFVVGGWWFVVGLTTHHQSPAAREAADYGQLTSSSRAARVLRKLDTSCNSRSIERFLS